MLSHNEENVGEKESELGREYYNQQKYTKAEQLLRQSVQQREKVLGAEHTDTLESKHDLALTLYELEKYAEGEQLLRQLTLQCEKVLGAEHADTLESKYDLALMLYEQQKYTEAEQLLRQLIQKQEEVLGAEHAETLTSKCFLAITFHKREQHIEAEQLLRQLVQQQEKAVGAEHADTLWGKHWLARTLHGQQKYTEAEQLLRQSVQQREKALGAEHDDTLRSKYWLALTLYEQQKCAEAEQLLQQLVQQQENILGTNHKETLESKELLQKLILAKAPSASIKKSDGNMEKKANQPSTPADRGLGGPAQTRLDHGNLDEQSSGGRSPSAISDNNLPSHRSSRSWNFPQTPPTIPDPPSPDGWETQDNPPMIDFDPNSRRDSFKVTVTCFKRKKQANDPDDYEDVTCVRVRFESWDFFPEFPKLKEQSRLGCQISTFIRRVLTDDKDYRNWKYYDLCPREAPSHEIYVRLLLESVTIPDSSSSTKICSGYSSQQGDLAIYCSHHVPQRHFRNLADHITCVVDSSGNEWGYRKFEIIHSPLYPSGEVPALKSEPSPPVEIVTTEEFQTARRWLNECRNSHKGCKREKYYPARLLNISSGNESLRLQTNNNSQNVDSYAALSYCWGLPENAMPDLPTHVSTTMNLKDREGGFHANDLPRTIVDAINLSRALGYNHIWIDSLCIIQDWKDDWLRESAKMSEIYACADLTIIARESVESSEGFTAAHDLPSFTASIPTEVGGLKYEMSITSLTPVKLIQPATRYRWRGRGWTLQEEALSNRVLYCLEDGFENASGSNNGRRQPLLEFECLQHHLRVKRGRKRSEGFPSRVLPWVKLHGLSNDQNSDWIWRNVVENYSTRTLKKETDILPALQGMAKRMSLSFGNPKYLAGLWEKSLIVDLCWTTAKRKSLENRGESFEWDMDPVNSNNRNTPTWSWSSLPIGSGVIWDHSLEAYGHDKLEFVNLVHASVHPSGHDAFGAVTNGCQIRLICKLIPASKLTANIRQDGIQVLFLVKGENRNEFDKWRVHHGIVLEPDGSSDGRTFRRIGSVSRVEGVTRVLDGEVSREITII